MGAEAITAILPVLRKVFAAIQNNDPDANDLCATFEVAGNSKAWVQVVANTINFGYPSLENSLDFLTKQGVKLLPDSAVVSWEKGLVATLSHSSCDADAVTLFVDRIFLAVHGFNQNGYVIDARIEPL